MWPSTERTLRDEARGELESSPASSADGAAVLIIGAAYALVGTIVCSRIDDAALRALLAAGALVTLGRLAAERRGPGASAAGSLAFAGCLGALGGRALLLGDEATRTLVVGLAFGYAAGLLMKGIARPLVSVPSLFLASTPLIAATFWRGDSASLALGGLMLLMLAGGLDRLKRIHDDFAERTARGRRFADLARADELTGLANRLALRELRDDPTGRVRPGGLIAAHCLDLDHFKPVNDAFGHSAGDTLLRAVAGRLVGAAGPGAFVARTGGDEFVVIQFDATDENEARALARRLAGAIRVPYIVHDRAVAIDVSVGTAVAPAVGLNLDDLIRRADADLYDDKARRDEPGPGPGPDPGRGRGRGPIAHRGDSVIPMPTPAFVIGDPRSRARSRPARLQNG